MPAFYSIHDGAVVSFAINKYIYVSVNRKFGGNIRVSYSQTENVNSASELKHDLVRETLKYYKVDHGIEIVSISDIPGEGTGLGSSSCFTDGLIKAMSPDLPAPLIAERAFDIEANHCRHPVGKQDHYAGAQGGMNYFKFTGKHVECARLYHSREMEEWFLLLWTGVTRPACGILTTQQKNFRNGITIGVGVQMAKLANQFRDEYLRGMSIPRMGEFLNENWGLKKQLSHVSSPEIDKWYDKGIQNGAVGGKILGAGRGGFMFFIAPPEKHGAIIGATGLEKIPFKIETEGSKVIYNE